MRGVMLGPLPLPEPDRLFHESYLPGDSPFSPGAMLDRHLHEYRARQYSFEHLAAFASREVTLSGGGEAVRLAGTAVEPGLFDVMGTVPALGRAFDADERDDAHWVLLSDNLWRARFGADSHVVGRSLTLD